ncbi:peptidase S8 [Longibacter salinarum]|uniref:Peptidase S8 n=1 Tax=Longibacter salinarum TaxID=1850348 RepID=A0A2A8D0S2_9BACT|nr:S8 family peptidase [Longibacter salinarum]PEN14403.1 peptidase S8 [Longibacter salinarum]
MPKARLFVFLLVLALVSGCSSSQPTVSNQQTSEPTTQTSSADTADTQAAESASSTEQAKPSESGPAPSGPPEKEAKPEPSLADAIESAPKDWQHRSLSDGDVPGIGTKMAYETILQGRKPRQTVVVAVIDSGVDTEHDDLDDNIWVNEDEVPGNSVDDDNNGYVDDVHGWNFLGGPDGDNIDNAPMELTRIVRTLGETFANVDSASVKPEYREDYERYQRLKSKLDEMRASKQQEFNNVRNAYEAMKYATQMLEQSLGTDSLSLSKVQNLTSPRRDLQQARDIFVHFAKNDLRLEDIEEYKTNIENQLRYGYDLEFDPRPIVGDNPDDLSERFYGNNDVTGPDATHGTHVAGIIAAERNNGLGIDGIAEGTKIMALRAVPDGDERDKDVANAIRYAADNGADIINMSFGKDYSPEKEAVDAAVRYADSLGVLMIHAAGNDGANVDSTDNFPSEVYLNGESPQAWITVGASSWKSDTSLAASFSNYGPARVDLFAPGVDIYSTTPDHKYDRFPGTSMAAPMVSGVAALIMAHYPELSAMDVRSILLESTTTFPDRMVVVPGGNRQVPFSSLSTTGGIVNVVEALKLAERHISAQ